MKIFFKLLGILLATIIVGGVAVWLLTPREKIAAYITPEVKYVTVTNAVINDSTALLDVELQVTSRLLPVFVDSVVYDFRLYNQSVAQGSQKFKPTSKTGNQQRLIIPVTVEHGKARALVKRQLAEGEKLEARVAAYCRFPLVGIRRIDITRRVDLAIPVLPGADLIGAR